MADFIFAADNTLFDWRAPLRTVLADGAFIDATGAPQNTLTLRTDDGLTLVFTGTDLVADGERHLASGTIGSIELRASGHPVFTVSDFETAPAIADVQALLTYLDSDGATTEGYLQAIAQVLFDEGLNASSTGGYNLFIASPFEDHFETSGGGDGSMDLSLNDGPLTIDFRYGTVTDVNGQVDTFAGISDATGTSAGDKFIARSSGGFHYWTGEGGADTYVGSDTVEEVVRFIFETGTHGVTVDLASGVGTDTYGNTESFSKINDLDGSGLDDTFRGDDQHNVFQGFAGDDYFDGRGGRDQVRFVDESNAGGTRGVIVNLSSKTLSGVSAEGISNASVAAHRTLDTFGFTDTIISISDVVGSKLRDLIVGDDAANWLFGGYGDDTIQGNNGLDALGGGSGADKLYGGSGDDQLEGGEGNDLLDGGSSDRFDLALYARETGSHGITANLKTGKVVDTFGTTDTLVSIEQISGTRFKDTFIGSKGGDAFEGNGSNDTIDGAEGVDIIVYANEYQFGGTRGVIVNLSSKTIKDIDIGYGDKDVSAGQARDTFNNTDKLSSIENVSGTAWSDYIVGSSKANELFAGAGNDSIIGGDGNDFLIGGLGRDIMTGGVGGTNSDTFYYASTSDSGTSSSTRDRILDFTHGKDKIGLSDIDANTTKSGNQEFDLLARGTSSSSVGTGKIGFYWEDHSGTSNDKTIVRINTDKDSAMEMTIELKGLINLSDADFWL